MHDAWGPRRQTLCWTGQGAEHAPAPPPHGNGGRTTFFRSHPTNPRLYTLLPTACCTCLIQRPGSRCDCGLSTDPLPTASLPWEPVCTPGSLADIWTHQCPLWGCLSPESPPDPRTWSAGGGRSLVSSEPHPTSLGRGSGGAAVRATSRHPAINAQHANHFPGVHGDVPPGGRPPVTEHPRDGEDG